MFDSNVLHKVLDSLPERICILDANGKIVYANHRWKIFAMQDGCGVEEKWLGYDYAELRCHEGICPEYAQKFSEALQEVIDGTKESFVLEHPCIDQEKKKWFLLKAERLHGEPFVMITQTDISGTVIAEKEREDHESRYLNLLEITSEGFWQIGLDKKTIIVNDSLCKMLGYSQEEMMGKTPLDFADEENQKIFKEQTSKISTSQHRTYEITLLHKSGKPVHTIFNATTYLNDNNEPLGGFAFVTDISEQKRIESELKETNNSLLERVEKEIADRMKIIEEKKLHEALMMQQSKMADMGEMIGVIAHQWKQPLNTIQLASNVIEDMFELDMYDAEKAEEFCEIISDQTKYMSDTIEEFRNFFKPTRDKQRFYVCTAAISAFNILKPKFQRSSIEFVLHTHKHESEHFEVIGHSGEFKQVIVNLLNNAHDAILASGEENGTVEIDFKRHDDTGDIIISDTGGGIPESLLPDELFNAYVTSKGDEGTGIGLYLAKLIIEEKMGGSVKVENGDKGAIFTISLPLVTENEDIT